MRKKPNRLRLRALRVKLMREDGAGWTFILFEDVDRHRFRMSSCSGGGFPRQEMEAVFDRMDAWSVLRRLREDGRDPEAAKYGWAGGSLDDVVSKDAAQTWKMTDLARARRASGGEEIVTPKEDEAEASQKRPAAMAIAMPSDFDPRGLSLEEQRKASDAMMQAVWNYAGGNPWKWESKGLTKAGRRCDVLTFGGSEIVIPGPTSLEIERD
jgi:hypothetical protein